MLVVVVFCCQHYLGFAICHLVLSMEARVPMSSMMEDLSESLFECQQSAAEAR